MAIYLLTQHKNDLSALSLRRQLDVSYNTAWLTKHKLMQTMVERDRAHPLSGDIQVDDAYWGGERHDGGDADRQRYWPDQVKAWRSSGLSARGWCEAQGRNVHTLRHWAWRLRCAGASAAVPTASPMLLPIRVSQNLPDRSAQCA